EALFNHLVPGHRKTDVAPHVRFGSITDVPQRLTDVRFTPESRHWNSVWKCPLSAKSGREQPQQSRQLERVRMLAHAGELAIDSIVSVGVSRRSSKSGLDFSQGENVRSFF